MTPLDNVSDREREQLEEIRQVYIRRFGFDPGERYRSPAGHPPTEREHEIVAARRERKAPSAREVQMARNIRETYKRKVWMSQQPWYMRLWFRLRGETF